MGKICNVVLPFATTQLNKIHCIFRKCVKNYQAHVHYSLCSKALLLLVLAVVDGVVL